MKCIFHLYIHKFSVSFISSSALSCSCSIEMLTICVYSITIQLVLFLHIFPLSITQFPFTNTAHCMHIKQSVDGIDTCSCLDVNTSTKHTDSNSFENNTCLIKLSSNERPKRPFTCLLVTEVCTL